MMQRFAILLLLSLSAIQCASAESTTSALRTTSNHAASHQRRELAVSDWWYTLLNALHVPCPPHRHGQCAHTSHSSNNGNGGGEQSSATGTDDGNGNNDSSSSSGGGGGSDSSTKNGGDDAVSISDDESTYYSNGGDDDGSAYVSGGDQWQADGWEQNNLGNRDGASGAGLSAGNIAPFVIGALIAGVMGAAFVVTRKRRQEQEDAHPLEGSLKKRMKLFSGGVFRRKKKGMLDDDVEEGGGGTPAFVEISSVQSGASVMSGTDGGYIAPKESSVIEGFDNESDDSDDDEM